MKKMFRLPAVIFVFTLISCIHLQVTAQTDTVKPWNAGGATSFMLTQVALSNWAPGGQNSLSVNAMVNLFANYHKDKSQWDNTLDLSFGMQKQAKNPMIKSDDKIDFSSKYGRYAFKHWYYSAMINFKSQFAQGFNYPNDSVMISDFMAPAYLTLALGMDYKPVEYFSLVLAPLTGRITFVNNQTLANQGSFGVDPAIYDGLHNVITAGKKSRSEFGGYLKAAFKYDIMKNVTLQLKLDMFTNYLKNPQNIDINGEMLLDMKINKYISANLMINTVYDDDVRINIDDNKDGITDRTGPRTQFKEVLAVGFSYKF